MDRHDRAMKLLAAGTVIPATPLVLDERRQFDESGQRLLIRYYLESGVGGIATAVHSTQFEIRDPKYNLFEPVLRVVSDEISRFERETGKTVVKIAGVCGKTEQALGETEIARRHGYDAVLLSPGGLGDLSEDEMIERTCAVAEHMSVVGFYLQPAAGGRRFTYSYWEKLCEIPNVAAIKCAPFNRYDTLDVVRACALSSRSDEIALYTGNDDNILVDLLQEYRFPKDGKTVTKRFVGGLLGHWCVWAHRVVQIFEQVHNRPVTPELLTLAAQITDANGVVFDAAHAYAGCIPGIHEVLRRQGLIRGIWCLNPEEALSPGQAQELDRIGAMYPDLNDDAFVKDFLRRHGRA